MKKMVSILLAGTLVLGLIITGALAAGPWKQGGGLCLNSGVCAQDSDGDGVCDNRGANCSYVDADGDGVCDNRGANCSYVDADGDGVCDNHGANCAHQDANGDGVCDLCGQNCGGLGCGNSQGLGNGQGHHGSGHHGGGHCN